MNNRVLRGGVIVLAVGAAYRLVFEFHRLIFSTEYFGAIDLRLRYTEVHRWFGGLPVYGELRNAVYPPATYALLWPLLGWLSLPAARWFWAATTVVMLGLLIQLFVRASGATTRLERVLLGLLVLATNAVGVTIGNGQLILHLLPALLIGMMLVARETRSWREDCLVATLGVVALAKPSVSLPFLGLLLFGPGRLRPVFLTLAGYAAVTVVAAVFQHADALTLCRQSLAAASAEVTRMAGYGNLHRFLGLIGHEQWNAAASLVALAAVTGWIYLYRRVDLWLLLGGAALVARLWAYHRSYDDTLILVPALALFRLTKQDPTGRLADGLFVVTAASLVALDRLHYLPRPWSAVWNAGNILLWLVVLIFLAGCAEHQRRRTARAGA